MGLLWRLLAPKPMKKARRSVRKAMNPVSLVTPKPVKQVRRAFGTVAHPVEAVEYGFQNQVVKALRGGRRSTRAVAAPRPDGLPHRITDAWIRKTVPRLSTDQVAYVINEMRNRGWTQDELHRRVYPYVRR
jgi:hypothetical protein